MEKEVEEIKNAFSERLEEHNNSRRAVQEEIHCICDELRRQANELEDSFNADLEAKFTSEDTRLQSALNDFMASLKTKDPKKVANATRKAKGMLFVKQFYKVKIKNEKDYNSDNDHHKEKDKHVYEGCSSEDEEGNGGSRGDKDNKENSKEGQKGELP